MLLHLAKAPLFKTRRRVVKNRQGTLFKSRWRDGELSSINSPRPLVFRGGGGRGKDPNEWTSDENWEGATGPSGGGGGGRSGGGVPHPTAGEILHLEL